MRINATFAQQQIALQYVNFGTPPPLAARADDIGNPREARRRRRVFLPMIPQPPAASHYNPSFPRRRLSCSPLSSRRRSAATCLPFRPFSMSSCASGSTRARSDGQSSSCFLREAPRRHQALILLTLRRSSSIWCVPQPVYPRFPDSG